MSSSEVALDDEALVDEGESWRQAGLVYTAVVVRTVTLVVPE
jgi:hypothetical protein